MNTCEATGQNIKWDLSEVVEEDGKKKVVCPVCGKIIKPKFADGGYDDDRPRYFYLPYHKRKI